MEAEYTYVSGNYGFDSVYTTVVLFTGCAEKDDPITGTPPELPGSDVIYPSVLYRGELYYWERLSHKPLPQPLTPIGEIEYIGEAEPDADLQFIGMFQVNGTAYFYAEEPDILCVPDYRLMTTLCDV